MSRHVQYEILLPRQFNDGTPVPASLYLQTKDELVQRFGGATFHETPVTGYWVSDNIEYRDSLVRVTVAGDATAENEAFMRQLKETLKQRFRQLEIWVVEYQVRIL
jgi:hypothetical protein